MGRAENNNLEHSILGYFTVYKTREQPRSQLIVLQSLILELKKLRLGLDVASPRPCAGLPSLSSVPGSPLRSMHPPGLALPLCAGISHVCVCGAERGWVCCSNHPVGGHCGFQCHRGLNFCFLSFIRSLGPELALLSLEEFAQIHWSGFAFQVFYR